MFVKNKNFVFIIEIICSLLDCDIYLASEDCFSVYIEILSGEKVEIKGCLSSMQISELKSLCQENGIYEGKEIILLLCGQELNNEATLESYEIDEGTTLNVGYVIEYKDNLYHEEEILLLGDFGKGEKSGQKEINKKINETLEESDESAFLKKEILLLDNSYEEKKSRSKKINKISKRKVINSLFPPKKILSQKNTYKEGILHCKSCL